MLDTVLGRLSVLINGQTYRYTPTRLSNSICGQQIDERYLIELKNLPEGECEIIIQILVDINNGAYIQTDIETGENLYSIGLRNSLLKLNIGIEGDIPGVIYKAFSMGMSVTIPSEIRIERLKMAIAWMHIDQTTEDSVLAWLGSDPNFNIS